MDLEMVSCQSDTVAIRKALLAGLSRNVATAQPSGMYRVGATGQQGQIHPSSALFRAAPPVILYGELVRTSKLCVNRVNPVLLSPNPLSVCVSCRTLSMLSTRARASSFLPLAGTSDGALPLSKRGLKRWHQSRLVGPRAERETWCRVYFVSKQSTTYYTVSLKNLAELGPPSLCYAVQRAGLRKRRRVQILATILATADPTKCCEDAEECVKSLTGRPQTAVVK